MRQRRKGSVGRAKREGEGGRGKGRKLSPFLFAFVFSPPPSLLLADMQTSHGPACLSSLSSSSPLLLPSLFLGHFRDADTTQNFFLSFLEEMDGRPTQLREQERQVERGARAARYFAAKGERRPRPLPSPSRIPAQTNAPRNYTPTNSKKGQRREGGIAASSDFPPLPAGPKKYEEFARNVNKVFEGRGGKVSGDVTTRGTDKRPLRNLLAGEKAAAQQLGGKACS